MKIKNAGLLTKIFMHLVTVLRMCYYVLLVLSIPSCGVPVALYDSPGASQSDYTNMLFWAMFLFPGVTLASLFIAREIDRYTEPQKWILIHLIPLMLILLGAYGNWGINHFQNGRLSP